MYSPTLLDEISLNIVDFVIIFFFLFVILGVGIGRVIVCNLLLFLLTLTDLSELRGGTCQECVTNVLAHETRVRHRLLLIDLLEGWFDHLFNGRWNVWCFELADGCM